MSQALVAQIKQQLLNAGKDLSGPCGAFAITKRVAWALRSTGAGLLSKPTGNNCDGYAVDIVAYPDGKIRDILGDGGGANTPQWPEGELEIVDASRYRFALDPGDEPLPSPPLPDPVPPTPEPVDLAPVLAAIAKVSDQVIALGHLVDALTSAVEELVHTPDPAPPPVVFPAYVGKLGLSLRLTPEAPK